MCSIDVAWSVVKNHSSFLVKRGRGSDRGQAVFSAEKGNLRNKHSIRYSGLLNTKAVDISGDKDGSAVLSVKRKGMAQKPSAMFASSKLPRKHGFRKGVRAINNATSGTYYRHDLRRAALARWSAITRNAKNRRAQGHGRVMTVPEAPQKK